MAALAIEHGVDALAHTPFSEHLSDEHIVRAVVNRQQWISTLDIHEGEDRERAAANLAAFARAGGSVLYGTDLGNGDRMPGVSADELRALDGAGVRGAALIRTLVDPWPAEHPATGVATFIPGPPPASADEIPDWLAAARVVPREELVPTAH